MPIDVMGIGPKSHLTSIPIDDHSDKPERWLPSELGKRAIPNQIADHPDSSLRGTIAFPEPVAFATAAVAETAAVVDDDAPPRPPACATGMVLADPCSVPLPAKGGSSSPPLGRGANSVSSPSPAVRRFPAAPSSHCCSFQVKATNAEVAATSSFLVPRASEASER